MAMAIINLVDFSTGTISTLESQTVYDLKNNIEVLFTKKGYNNNDANLVGSDKTNITNATNVQSAPTIINASGVSAGTYGSNNGTTIQQGVKYSVWIPSLTVNEQGLVTSAANNTLTIYPR